MGRSRQTAPYAVPQCMVFRPTLEEMKDFQKYMEYMESQGAHYAGIAKIIPPDEWQPRKAGYDIESIKDIVIKRPIKQTFTSVGEDKRAYQTKSSSRSPMTIQEYYDMSQSHTYRTPPHHSHDDLERKYWKSLTFVPPTYGADITDSITDHDCEIFNISKLKSVLNYISEDQNQSYAGVTTPYLYIGSWKTTFSWHVEDMDLYAINYLHFGMPKTWYCVPPKYGHLLEKAYRQLFPNVASWCSNFMRHKTCLANPSLLDELGVPYQKVVQEERNAIIVYPYAYHSGFNHGFNCAESTNFALERWVEYGKRCRPCDCTSNSVKLNMDCFVKRFQPELYEKWQSGKDIAPHPEDPPEIAELIKMRAENPEAYAALMTEKLQKEAESNSERLMFYTSTGRSLAVYKSTLRFVRGEHNIRLNENEIKEFEYWKEEQRKHSNIIFQEAGGPIVSVDRRLVHIYQHVELKQIKVKILPRTLTVIGDGLTILKQALPNERFETVKELIDKGALVKIGERQMKRKSKKNSPDSPNKKIKENENKTEDIKLKCVEKTIYVLRHTYMDLKATVFSDNLNKYYGEQTDALKTVMEGNDMNALYNNGTFEKIQEFNVKVEEEIKPKKNMAKPLSKKKFDILKSSNDPKKAAHEIEETIDFGIYSIFKEVDTGKEIVINPNTLAQPDINPLEILSLEPGESIIDLIKEKKLELILEGKKFKKGCKYVRHSTPVKVYTHTKLNADLLVNAITMKLHRRGRPKQEVKDCLSNQTLEDMISSGVLIFQRDETHHEYVAPHEPRPKCLRPEALIPVKKYKVNLSLLSEVDLVYNDNRILYRFDMQECQREINEKVYEAFFQKDAEDLINSGIIEAVSSDISDEIRLQQILKCDVVPKKRFKFRVKGVPKAFITTDETKTKVVKRVSDSIKHVLQLPVQVLIKEGTLYDETIERGFLGAVALKKAILGVDSSIELKKATENHKIDIQNYEGSIVAKNYEKKECLLIVPRSFRKPEVEDTVEIKDKLNATPNENTLETPSLEMAPLENTEEVVGEETTKEIMDIQDDVEIDEDDYDDIEDSEEETFISENENSDNFSNDRSDISGDEFSSDDPDFVYGRPKIFGRHSRRKKRKLSNLRQTKRTNTGKTTGRKRNLRRYTELAEDIVHTFNGKTAEEFTVSALKNSIDDEEKRSKVDLVLQIMQCLKIIETLNDSSGSSYIWRGFGAKFEATMYEILSDNIMEADDTSSVCKDIIRVIASQKKHYVSMNEIIRKIAKPFSMLEGEGTNVYTVLAIFAGLKLSQRKYTFVTYIGPDIYKKYLEDQFKLYAEEYNLNPVNVCCERVKVDDNFWTSYYEYFARKQRKEKIIVGIATQDQKTRAAIKGVCQCGVSIDYKGPTKGEMGRSSAKVTVGQKRKTRCGTCEGCLAKKCMQCDYCTKPHLKKPCRKRFCLKPQLPKCPCFM